MSSVLILRRSGHAWPILLAANYDADPARLIEAPDYHWPDLADIVGGWDQRSGGSWLAVNANGVVAAVIARHADTGPRSVLELPLEALSHADASAAAESLVQLDTKAYAPFNLVVADNTFACWLKHDGSSAKIQVSEIPEGCSMITASDRNDYAQPRIKAYLPRLQAARIPDPDAGQWRDWQVLLGQRLHNPADGPAAALCITEGDVQTRCSQLLAIPAVDNAQPAKFLFAHGRPGETEFMPVVI